MFSKTARRQFATSKCTLSKLPSSTSSIKNQPKYSTGKQIMETYADKITFTAKQQGLSVNVSTQTNSKTDN